MATDLIYEEENSLRLIYTLQQFMDYNSGLRIIVSQKIRNNNERDLLLKQDKVWDIEFLESININLMTNQLNQGQDYFVALIKAKDKEEGK